MLLLVLVLFSTAVVTPVRAECSPSNAVVAVVSVVSTLVVVAITMLAIYFILRRRRQKDSYLKTRKVDSPRIDGDLTDGYVNAGFDKSDPSLAEEGLITVESRGSKQAKKTKKKNDGGQENNTKTWSSFPEREQPGILYRPGSCGSLDDNMYPNPEIMTVCLESQDIIGLGFNISGNFGEGIQVSQVHNRGPAVESGKVKVGDKILSVEVSYENIVYEDALTILSYASPYPVKIKLQKADSRRSRDSAIYRKDLSSSSKDEKVTVAQLNHPLYRSQSMDALKLLGKLKDTSNPPFQPKRTQSEMKPETRKDGVKIRKKGDRNSKSFVHDVLDKIAGTISPSKSNTPNKHEMVVSDVVVHHGEEENDSVQNRSLQIETLSSAQVFSIEDSDDPDKDEIPQTNSKAAMELATLMDDKFDLKHDEHDIITLTSPASPNYPPNKPERKNKKQDSFEFQNVSLDSSKDTEESNSEIDEDVIVPSSKRNENHFGDSDIQLEPLEFHAPPAYKKYEDINEALSPLKNTDVFSISTERSPSPNEDAIVEDIIEPSEAKRDSSAIVADLEISEKHTKAEEKGTNTEPPEVVEEKEEKNSAPALDEAMLERLIAMNSYEPGTQGWAGIQAGGTQGGIMDDFIPDSKDFVPQPVVKPNVNEGSLSRPMSPPSVAFEIRDDVVKGVPVAVGIKSRQVMRESSPSPSTPGSHNVNTVNFREGNNNNNSGNSIQVVNKVYSYSNDNNNSNNNNNNSSSFTKEILVTSQERISDRLGYSENKSQNDSGCDWKDSKIVDNKVVDSHNCMDDLTDSDSEGIETDNPSSFKIGLSSDISNKSKVTENSDISNSFTSSSGEATPPYSSNGQELGSSPEFSLSKSPLELMSGKMETEDKSNPSITLNLHRQDDDGDMEC